MNPYLHSTKSFLVSFLLTIAFLSIFACSKQEDLILNPPSSERGYLLTYHKTGNMKAKKIISINRDEGDLSDYAIHDLDIYSIVYNSLAAGEPVAVSGLVLIPKNTMGPLDLIQNHHGTIIPGIGEDETPSTYTGGKNGSSEMYFVGAALASNGYVVSMPDYVGYGHTINRAHPYTVHHELAEVSVDMLRATQQLMTTLSLHFSNNVFLTGWSEGGGAGLATHKYLQEKYPSEFKVKASSLLAGPYDYFTFFKDILANKEVEKEELSIYSWSVYALNQATLNRSANSIWNYRVTDQMSALDVPSYKASEIFQAAFTDGVINETDTDFIAIVKENSLLEGWTPQGYLFFHSGTDDQIVPHYNSTNAHQHFQAKGANSTLYEYPNGDHYTPLYNYVTTTLDDFRRL